MLMYSPLGLKFKVSYDIFVIIIMVNTHVLKP